MWSARPLPAASLRAARHGQTTTRKRARPTQASPRLTPPRLLNPERRIRSPRNPSLLNQSHRKRKLAPRRRPVARSPMMAPRRRRPLLRLRPVRLQAPPPKGRKRLPAPLHLPVPRDQPPAVPRARPVLPDRSRPSLRLAPTRNLQALRPRLLEAAVLAARFLLPGRARRRRHRSAVERRLWLGWRAV